MIRVLIVDDSSLYACQNKNAPGSQRRYQGYGNCQEWYGCNTQTIVLKPDVITMDINMPDISGIEAVEQIMKQRPTPIIMISSRLHMTAPMKHLKALEKGR